MRTIYLVFVLLNYARADAPNPRPEITLRPFDLMACATLLTVPAEGPRLFETAYGAVRPTALAATEWAGADEVFTREEGPLDALIGSPDVEVTYHARRIEGVARVQSFLRTVVAESARWNRVLSDEVPDPFWTLRRVSQILLGTDFARELERRVYEAARAPGAPPISEARFWAKVHHVIPNIQFRAELLGRLALDRDLRIEWMNNDRRRSQDVHRAIKKLLNPAHESGRWEPGPNFFEVGRADLISIQKWMSHVPMDARLRELQLIFWDVKLILNSDLKIDGAHALPFDVKTAVRRDAEGHVAELVILGRIAHINR